MKAYKYRIYPNKAQEQYFAQCFGNARFVYNWALNKRDEIYKKGDKANRYQVSLLLTQLKKSNERLQISGAQTLQEELINLERAYKAFFKHKSNHPRYKSKHDKQSITYPQSVALRSNNVVLPKLGQIKTILHRELQGNIKRATITKTATGKYFVSILTDYEAGKPTVNGQVGIDLGVKEFAILSDGKIYKNPKYLNASLKRLQRLNKSLSRKKNGSSNKNKARLLLAKQHEKVGNQREDYLHKISTEISNQYGLVCIEDLHVKGMLKNHKLARSISDAGWSMFTTMLAYKANKLIKIGRFVPSSKTCSNCGNVKAELSLSQRTYNCDVCRMTMDRDLNAAKNILNIGLSTAGDVGINACRE